MNEAYIFDAVRTPRGKGRQDGALSGVTPVELAATVLRAIRDRLRLDAAAVDDVILGVVEAGGEQGACIARIAALCADYPESVPGSVVSRFCASGLEACNQAAAMIAAGQADLVVAGGVESMSRVPMFSAGGAWWSDPAVVARTRYVPQGVSADLLATLHGYTRCALDAYAAESQRRAALAWEAGYFAGSIVPVVDAVGRILLDHDEYRRPQTTMASLAKLEPAFRAAGEGGFDAVTQGRYPQVDRVEHRHHAGNSAGIVDGAAAVLLGTRSAGERAGLKPRARLRAFATVGSEPTLMLTGPVPATDKALRRAGMECSNIDLFEVNEAFAAVVLYYLESFDLDPARVNVNGGAIALGHPLGATGAMLLGTVLDELERRDRTVGLVTLCAGGGMGTAAIIERL